MSTHPEHHASHGHHDVSQDKGAAFVGLFAGLVVLGALTYGMVVWTNGRFAGHAAAPGGAQPAAAAAAH